jgi:hypothetical protein
MRRLSVFAAALLVTACGGEPAAPEAAETAQSPAPDATLDLEASGIVVPAQGGAEQLDVPFGSTRAAAEASIGSVAGAVQERGANAECGAGPLEFTTYDGLVLLFAEGSFAGWSATSPYVPQISRAEMLADPAVTLVEGSTLGEEFTIGGGQAVISGLFTSAEGGAEVETLWAGQACVFR